MSKIKDPVAFDVGCGFGTESLWLALNGANVLGIDIQNDRINVARKRREIMVDAEIRDFHCNFERKSLFELTDVTQFDIIWMEQTLHHIEPRQVGFEKISQLLKAGGKFVVSEVNAWNPLLQLQLFKKRGFRTIAEFKDVEENIH